MCLTGSRKTRPPFTLTQGFFSKPQLVQASPLLSPPANRSLPSQEAQASSAEEGLLLPPQSRSSPERSDSHPPGHWEFRPCPPTTPSPPTTKKWETKTNSWDSLLSKWPNYLFALCKVLPASGEGIPGPVLPTFLSPALGRFSPPPAPHGGLSQGRGLRQLSHHSL